MIVHMGWVGSDPPQSIFDAVERTRAAATGCEVMFHTDESLVPQARREAVARFIPQWRSDVQRHAVLERYGGLWLDADVRLLVSPAAWAASWGRYTAVKLGKTPLVGTDILFVPNGWRGWSLVNDHIDHVLATASDRVDVLAIAGGMVRRLARQHADLFNVIAAPDVYPFSQREFTSASVVARNFDPAGLTPRPAAPGLGDMIAAGLASIGITKELAQAVAGRVGIKDCGCGKRQAAANRLGTYLGLPPGSTAES